MTIKIGPLQNLLHIYIKEKITCSMALQCHLIINYFGLCELYKLWVFIHLKIRRQTYHQVEECGKMYVVRVVPSSLTTSTTLSFVHDKS